MTHHRRDIVVVWMSLGILFCFSSSWAQPYREHLALPSMEINQNLLNHARAGEFTKIERILPVIKSLTDAIKAKYLSDVEFDLKTSLETRDPGKVLKAVRHLIYFDVKDLMSLAMDQVEQSPQKAMVTMKAAYLNYLLLSSYIETVNFSSDQKIKNYFRQAILAMDTSSYSDTARDPSITGGTYHQKISQLVSKIDGLIAVALDISK